MQLGIGTYSFPWAVGVKNFSPPQPLTATELLHYAAEKDIHVVQFGDNYPLHDLNNEELEELKNLALQLHVEIQVGTRRLAVENIIRYISIAGSFQSDFLRIVIDDDGYHPTPGEVIDIINQVLPDLKKAKLNLAIENHDRFPALVLKEIIESTDVDHIAICLDTANSLGAGEGLGEIVSILAPYTVTLHIKDVTVNRLDHKMGFRVSGCAAGTGILNISLLIENVKKYGRCNSAILEMWSDPEASFEETIRKEKDSVEKSIEYLKTILT
jgi:sugar phosphate isomerase/epimerase